MTKTCSPVRFVLLLPVLGGCAATSSSAPAVELLPSRAVQPAVPAAAASAPTPERAPAAPQGPTSGAMLKVWNDPAFQKQFAESYLAETDVEPRLTAGERDSMQGVLDAIAADQPGKAIALLEAERSDASSAVFDFTLGNLHFQQEKPDVAAPAYEVAVRKYPKFRRAWKNLGLCRVRLGDFGNAAPAFTRVVELGGGDAVTYGLLGFCYSNLQDFVAAESAYRMAALLDPRTLDWRMGLARSFIKQQRFADAASLCGTLIGENPDRADLWLLQANAYVGMQQRQKAAENLELVDRLGQSTADSLFMLGDIYVNEELWTPAVGAYVRAMDKNPQAGADRAVRAAKVLTARGALAESAELTAAIEDAYGDRLPTEAKKDLLKLRSRLAMAQGAGEEEARVLAEIVALDPLDGEALILLGQHALRTGKPEQAVFYYERAAGIEAFEADAKVRHAQLLVGQGKYGEALPMLKRAQTLKPRDNIQQYLEQVERIAQSR